MSNYSTGLMGYELARLARKRNYGVTLISGPTQIKPPRGVKPLRIETARQLQKMVHRELGKADVLVMTSAVSDFRPASFSHKKIKSKRPLALKLVRNPDILGSISNRRRKRKIIAGFSLETEDLLRNAARKMKDKDLDLIIANKATRRHTPFGRGAKTVYLLDRQGRKRKLEKVSKTRIARAILDTIVELCYTSN
jgi:phosphopantothenoylcysteine decarboxylase/phosphopantothenate--cysteine ligase